MDNILSMLFNFYKKTPFLFIWVGMVLTLTLNDWGGLIATIVAYCNLGNKNNNSLGVIIGLLIGSLLNNA